MTFYTGIGSSSLLDSRDAGLRAFHAALAEFGGENLGLVWVFVSNEYNIQNVVGGIVAQLGSVPLMGFSTSGELTSEGAHRRSVVVAVMGGDDLNVKADWMGSYAENPKRTIERLLPTLGIDDESEGVLFTVLDGLSSEAEVLCQNLPMGKYTLAGCLSGGDLQVGRTFQIGGDQAGSGGLAAAYISGDVNVGVGIAHGWAPVGVFFKITLARGAWIRSLDGRIAADRYADYFGRSGRDWSSPPLNSLVRLYPLGLEQPGRSQLKVRTPLRVEADGSLRMSDEIEDGSIGHLLVGSVNGCLDAARRAARKALEGLDGAQPKLALVFADISWEMLMKGQPGSEVAAIQEVLGKNVPIVGGYTFGQLAHTNGSRKAELLNQHIEVVVFG